MIGQLFLETLHLLILADKNTEFFVNEEYFVNSFKNREIKNMASFISQEFIFWLLLLSML